MSEWPGERDYMGLKTKLLELLENFQECAVHEGYTHAAQTTFRVCAHDLEQILDKY